MKVNTSITAHDKIRLVLCALRFTGKRAIAIVLCVTVAVIVEVVCADRCIYTIVCRKR